MVMKQSHNPRRIEAPARPGPAPPSPPRTDAARAAAGGPVPGERPDGCARPAGSTQRQRHGGSVRPERSADLGAGRAGRGARYRSSWRVARQRASSSGVNSLQVREAAALDLVRQGRGFIAEPQETASVLSAPCRRVLRMRPVAPSSSTLAIQVLTAAAAPSGSPSKVI